MRYPDERVYLNLEGDAGCVTVDWNVWSVVTTSTALSSLKNDDARVNERICGLPLGREMLSRPDLTMIRRHACDL